MVDDLLTIAGLLVIADLLVMADSSMMGHLLVAGAQWIVADSLVRQEKSLPPLIAVTVGLLLVVIGMPAELFEWATLQQPDWSPGVILAGSGFQLGVAGQMEKRSFLIHLEHCLVLEAPL